MWKKLYFCKHYKGEPHENIYIFQKKCKGGVYENFNFFTSLLVDDIYGLL